jgi:nucleoid DNA-binding protein
MTRAVRWLFLVVLAAAACERDTPVPTAKQTATSEQKPVAARLADEVVKLAPEEVLALPDLGWLQMKRYRAYEGRNPRTGESVSVPEARIPFFHQTGGHWDRQLTDERHRFLTSLHPGDPESVAGEDPAIQVRRFSWADETCEAAARELETNGTTTIAGVGTFTVENGQVRYTIAPELEQRLSSNR